MYVYIQIYKYSYGIFYGDVSVTQIKLTWKLKDRSLIINSAIERFGFIFLVFFFVFQ